MSYGYIAKLSEKVERQHVRFYNRFGIALAGDLYTAKDLDRRKKYPAVIIGAPYGGVKEQGPCVYANELARRGFVVLTFDQPFMGGSGGEPRHTSSPEMFTESFSACVDFLGVKVPLSTGKRSAPSVSAVRADLRSPRHRRMCASRRWRPRLCM